MTELGTVTRPGRGLRYAPPAVALAAVALFLLPGFNVVGFQLLNHAARLLPDVVWGWITLLGDALTAFVLLLPFVRRYPQVVWAAFVAALFATAWTHGIKNLAELPRPPAELGAELLHIVGPVLRRNTFPSGHTTTIFTFAGVWALSLAHTRISMALIALAVLVGFSRIAVGVHWPLDVAMGALGGWLSALAGIALARRWQWGLGRTARRIQLMVLLACAVALIGHDDGYPYGAWLTTLIAVPALAIGLWHALTVLLRHSWVQWREDGSVFIYES